MTVNIRTKDLWIVMPCSFQKYWCHLHLQGRSPICW